MNAVGVHGERSFIYLEVVNALEFFGDAAQERIPVADTLEKV